MYLYIKLKFDKIKSNGSNNNKYKHSKAISKEAKLQSRIQDTNNIR